MGAGIRAKSGAKLRTFHCVNLGCAENALDGSLIASYLEGNDWQEVGRPEDADLILVNSCGVTVEQEDRSIDVYHDLTSRKRPDARVVFAGCLPAINKQRVRDAGYQDVLISPRRLHVLDKVIDARVPIDVTRSGCVPATADNIGLSFDGTQYARGQAMAKRAAAILRAVPGFPVPRLLLQFLYAPDADTEFVRISVGCRNKCSFCSIPRAKGSTKSVPPAVVVERVQDAVRRGKTAISLSCDELASYGQDLGTDIVFLLEQLTRLPDQYRLILRNVHPEWIIRYWEGLEPSFRRGKISYIVIPVQSGSDRILERMNRNHTADEFRRLLTRIRQVSPETIIRTHVLVGFPGETETDFWQSYALVKRLPIDSLCVHAYSERSFTPSASLPDKVPAAVAQQRAEVMMTLDPLYKIAKLYAWAHRLVSSSRRSSHVATAGPTAPMERTPANAGTAPASQ